MARDGYAVAGRALMYRLVGAFCRAWRDGRPVVGTEYVLAELAAVMPSLRRALAMVSGERKSRLDRRLRACLREFDGPETPDGDNDRDGAGSGVEFEVSAVLREAAWRARRKMARVPARDRPAPGVAAPVWSATVRATVRRALVDAGHIGIRHAHGMHLAVSILANPADGAGRLVSKLGRDPARLLADAPVTRSLRHDGTPMTPTADALLLAGVLTTPRSATLRLLGRALIATIKPRWHTNLFVVIAMNESVRQAIRLDAAQVSQAHLTVALSAVEDQLQVRGRQLADRWADHNRGGQTLTQWGAGYPSTAAYAACLPAPTAAACHRWPWPIPADDPPYGVDVTVAVERAERYAAQLGHPYPATSHLLAALLADQDGAGTHLLTTMGVNTDALTRHVTEGLGLPGNNTRP
jgi:Clp amino terminal domain, pathogenicity island component